MAAALWKSPASIETLNSLMVKTLGEVTGMEFVEVGPRFLRMRMPVDERTKQPMGLLHGGASAALAETAGSVASTMCIDLQREAVVGIELNCSHLRAARSGWVYAHCAPFRIGRTMHVWDIQLTNEKEKLVCVCRLTVSVIRRNRDGGD